MARAMRGGDVTLRNIRMDKAHFRGEVAMLLDIINDAWSDNWGYVPMTQAEIDDLAGILKLLLKPGDVAIAEYKGEPAAFAAIFPNLNEAIRDMNVRLFPFNWIKLLWRMKVKRPKPSRMPPFVANPLPWRGQRQCDSAPFSLPSNSSKGANHHGHQHYRCHRIPQPAFGVAYGIHHQPTAHF